jgi:hypothetical protein
LLCAMVRVGSAGGEREDETLKRSLAGARVARTLWARLPSRKRLGYCRSVPRGTRGRPCRSPETGARIPPASRVVAVVEARVRFHPPKSAAQCELPSQRRCMQRLYAPRVSNKATR